MFLLRLTLATLSRHRVRVALTLAAIALSVSLVIAVTSGYASARAAAHQGVATFLGTTDASIVRVNNMRGGISPDLLQQLRDDPAVLQAIGRLEMGSSLLKADGSPVVGLLQVIGIQRPDDQNILAMRMNSGAWFDTSDAPVAVVDQVALDKLGAKLGEEFILPSVDRQLRLKIVGVVHKPGILAAAIQTIYVPIHTLQKFMLPQNPDQLSRVFIDLRPGSDADAFEKRWHEKLAAINPDLKLRMSNQIHREMDANLEGLQAMSYMGGAVAMLAAMFIIFSTLSMGVSERQRSLAMLRAVGALRSQLSRLVVIEGLILATAGVLIGIPLGVLWIKLLAWKYNLLFSAGGVVSIPGTLYAIGGSIATALAASMMPAAAAMRASPLDAMTPLATPPQLRSAVKSFLLGLVLLAVDPIILFGPFNRTFQFYGHFVVGIACVMIGVFLLGPLIVYVIERVAGPIVAATFGLRFALLRQQLSGGAWRAAGSAAALMVGLAVLIVTQTQGTSAINGWKLPDKFPDVFIYSFLGLGAEDQKRLFELNEFRPGEIMPIAMASPEFGVNFWGIAGAAVMPNATIFFGIDPDKTLDLMDLDFREGKPEEAKRLLKQGRHLIVTQEFRNLKNIGVGDKLPLKTSQGNLDFTIAAVVWSPAIDVITTTQDLGRQFDQRTAASVFGSLDDAKQYFGVDRIHLYAGNLKPGVEKDQLMSKIKRWGLDAGDVRQIKHSIQRLLYRLLALVSTIAYAALAVASLGVTNTIMAGIRSRRWHLGILRSIGVTRGQLLRLVLAEAVLLGLVGILMGCISGFVLAIDAHQGWGQFIGYRPPLVVPWNAVISGMWVVMGVAVLSSLWPAIEVARGEPLDLLMAGRAST